MATVDKIVTTFESRFDELSSQSKLHWYLRRYRIGQETSALVGIRQLYLSQAKDVISKFKDLDGPLAIEAMGKRILKKLKTKSVRIARRFDYYQAHPEILVHLRLVLFLFLTKSLGMEGYPGIKCFYEKFMRYYARHAISKLFLEAEFIKLNPSQCANVIYYLKFLGISDQTQALNGKFKNIFLQSVPKDKNDWLTKIYALTHLIIAASNYYQNFVGKEVLGWVLDYFQKEILKIVENTSPDVVAEVGLSFKLCQDFNNPVINTVVKYLNKRFDVTKGYVPKEKGDSLDSAEHRNIVAVMLFTDFSKLFPGPKIHLS